jgi:hypothetical protein
MDFSKIIFEELRQIRAMLLAEPSRRIRANIKYIYSFKREISLHSATSRKTIQD